MITFYCQKSRTAVKAGCKAECLSGRLPDLPCLTVCLIACLTAGLNACLTACLNACLTACLNAILSVCLPA